MNFKLDPGECFVVDNTRVMHARSAFELLASGDKVNASSRWLQGCYVERDGLFSEIAVLEKKLQNNILTNSA